jgi:5-methylcytosine-specific restriction endonuclease McrA
MRAWARANPEKIAESSRRHRNSSTRKAWLAAWREDNREKLNAQQRARRAADPERERQLKREWREANPERYALSNRSHAHARRARARNAEGAWSRDEFLSYSEEIDQWTCAVCWGAPEHVDHVVPIARGGLNEVGNLQWLCAPCNLSKGARLMSEWLPGRLQQLAEEGIL